MKWGERREREKGRRGVRVTYLMGMEGGGRGVIFPLNEAFTSGCREVPRGGSEC